MVKSDQKGKKIMVLLCSWHCIKIRRGKVLGPVHLVQHWPVTDSENKNYQYYALVFWTDALGGLDLEEKNLDPINRGFEFES